MARRSVWEYGTSLAKPEAVLYIQLGTCCITIPLFSGNTLCVLQIMEEGSFCGVCHSLLGKGVYGAVGFR